MPPLDTTTHRRQICHGWTSHLAPHHIFVCPRLFTSQWHRALFKFADVVLEIPTDSRSFWPSPMHELLVLGLMHIIPLSTNIVNLLSNQHWAPETIPWGITKWIYHSDSLFWSNQMLRGGLGLIINCSALMSSFNLGTQAALDGAFSPLPGHAPVSCPFSSKANLISLNINFHPSDFLHGLHESRVKWMPFK